MRRQECFENWAALHDGRGGFPSEALESAWKRSEDRDIDYARALPRELTASELERAKKVYKRLMMCSDWAVNHLVANSTEDELRVLLFSRDGVLLRIYGFITETDWLTSVGIHAGTKWSEETIGANPFSLGMQQRRALDMTGDLCFARALVDGSYFFAPVCVNENEVFGSVVIAVPIEKSNPYLLSVATTVARTIELDVFLFQCIDQFTSSDEESGSIFLRPNKGRNEVVLINDQVFKILGIKKPDTYHLTLEDIILPPPDNRDFWNIIDGKKTVYEKAISISAPSGRVYVNMSTVIYKQNKFHPDGVTISFSANNKIGRFSPKYTDNNARFTFNDIIGENALMLETIKRSRIAAQSDSNILIQGESGVGKDVFAQAIHNGSKRSHKPFVAINCAAFSKELIASELFGYESGAFTGAKREGSIGKFELANHGTLFLDEIGDMPLEVQSILLRVLEEKAFRKVGGNNLIEVDVRIIAATNKNLKELIEQKQFREDLFYRLSIIRINVPPLRARGEDVYLFADYFIKSLCSRMGKADIRLSKGAMDFLGKYSWPGNIRELQNLLEGIISTHEETLIGEHEIQSYLGDYFNETLPEPAATSDVYGLDERERFEIALKKCRNNKTKAAEYLGLSRSTFYRRLQEFGMK